MSSREVLTISIFTLITVIAWITFDLYHAMSESIITEVQQELIAPLDPKLDRETINKLRQ